MICGGMKGKIAWEDEWGRRQHVWKKVLISPACHSSVFPVCNKEVTQQHVAEELFFSLREQCTDLEICLPDFLAWSCWLGEGKTNNLLKILYYLLLCNLWSKIIHKTLSYLYFLFGCLSPIIPLYLPSSIFRVCWTAAALHGGAHPESIV